MFLVNEDQINLFNKIIREDPTLEPYFAELALWCYFQDKEKYFELVEESRRESDGALHLRDISEKLNNILESKKDN